MVKKLLFGCVLFGLLVTGISAPEEEKFITTEPIQQVYVPVYWNWHGNIYSIAFDKTAWETLLIVFNNGDVATLTGHLINTIPVNAGYFAYMCKYYDKEVSDIAILIHNHLLPSRFSLGDRRFYEDLKRYGFQGEYLLYLNPGSKIKKYHGENKTTDLLRPYILLQKEKKKNEQDSKRLEG